MRRPLLFLSVFLFLGVLGLAPGSVHADPQTDDAVAVEALELMPSAPFADEVAGTRLTWDRHERALMWSYIALNAVDTYQTMNLPAGYDEGNPLLGSRPRDLQVVAFKAATTWGLLKLTDRFTHKRRTRKTVLWLINSIQLSVNVHNETISGGILF